MKLEKMQPKQPQGSFRAAQYTSLRPVSPSDWQPQLAQSENATWVTDQSPGLCDWGLKQ